MGKRPARHVSLLLCILVCAALLGLFAPLEAGQPFPSPRGAVNDFAGVIPSQYVGPMENLAREVLEKTGTAIVIATVETVGESDPNDYANRLYQAWGIGKKGEDKGVLIFLALKERRVRIETGYGVEGILPDGLVGEILDRTAIPSFREGRYGQGFSDTMAAVASVVANAAGVTLTGVSAPERQTRGKRAERGIGIFQLLLFAAAAFFLLGTRQGRELLPWLLLLMMQGSGGRRGGDGFGGFGGGFGGFGGGMSGGGGASRGF